MVERPVRIGFLGAGLIATFHSKNIRLAAPTLPFAIERTGVFDPDRRRAEAFAAASGHVVVDDERAVIESADAVWVCTWTSEHERLVTLAAEAGRAVFCEKPLAPDLDGARRIADVLMRTGVVNQVGLILRRSPAYLWARRLVTEPTAGRVMSVVFRDDQFIPVQGHYASTWRGDPARAGAGTLIEHSIHDVDMLHAVVGPIGAVSARQAHFHGIDGIEDAVSATFSFEPGPAIGSLNSIWHDNLARPSLRRVEIFCERRSVVIEGDWLGPVTWIDHDGGSGRLEGDDLVRAATNLVPGDPNPDAAFLRAVASGQRAHPDALVALRAHEVVDAAYRSARSDGDSVRVGAVSFRRATTDEVRPLRLDVLRHGMTNRSVEFDGDDDPDTTHLVAVDHRDRIVATSTWLRRDTPHAPRRTAMQLRGMATERTRQGTGLGGRLLHVGLAHARDEGSEIVWANARDAALDFYLRHGFEIVGDGFIEPVTQLPHHVVIAELH